MQEGSPPRVRRVRLPGFEGFASRVRRVRLSSLKAFRSISLQANDWSVIYLLQVKKGITLGYCLLIYLWALAQYDSITIENKAIARKFYFSKINNGFFTKAFVNKATNENYVNPATEEFSLTIDDKLLNGLNCRYDSHLFSTEKDTTQLVVTLQTPLNKVYLQLV